MTRVVWRGSGLRGGSGARAAARPGAGVGRRVGVMGLDLGGRSGTAWWTGELLTGGSLHDTLASGDFGFREIDCGGGTVAGERAGAEAISRLWMSMAGEWSLAGIAVQAQYLCIEDFILRSKIGSKQRVGLSSPRLAGLVEGMLVRVVAEREIARYPASRSKPFATSDRLKKWGLWCRGSEHCRDAAKQVALHVACLLEGA
jgi:hypothetical protein